MTREAPILCASAPTRSDVARIAVRARCDARAIHRYLQGRTRPGKTREIETALRELGLEQYIVRRIIAPANRVADFLPPNIRAID